MPISHQCSLTLRISNGIPSARLTVTMLLTAANSPAVNNATKTHRGSRKCSRNRWRDRGKGVVTGWQCKLLRTSGTCLLHSTLGYNPFWSANAFRYNAMARIARMNRTGWKVFDAIRNALSIRLRPATRSALSPRRVDSHVIFLSTLFRHASHNSGTDGISFGRRVVVSA